MMIVIFATILKFKQNLENFSSNLTLQYIQWRGLSIRCLVCFIIPHRKISFLMHILSCTAAMTQFPPQCIICMHLSRIS